MILSNIKAGNCYQSFIKCPVIVYSFAVLTIYLAKVNKHYRKSQQASTVRQHTQAKQYVHMYITLVAGSHVSKTHRLPQTIHNGLPLPRNTLRNSISHQ